MARWRARARVGRAWSAVVLLGLGLGLGLGGVAGAQAPPPTRPPVSQPPPTRPPVTQPPPTPPLPTAPRPTAPGPTLRPPTTVAPPQAGDGASSFDLVGLLVPLAILAAIVGVGVVALRNRSTIAAPAVSAAPSTAAGPAGPSPLTHELLEVSRQLTAAATRGDVRRAVVRGALTLVPADAAALVATAPALVVEAESRPDTLVAEQLADGLVGRVAETGESIAQVSATEPAVRHLPAAMIALPLVGGGRVESVLVLLRSAELPFGDAEVKVLRALVPMAAAALGTERAAQSALEESRRDALTGAHNRRQFDADLAGALAGGDGPVSLAIIDLDHFKRVNDTYGHPAGDALLRGVVERIRSALRPGDGLYRFGGEEFCLLLAGAAADEAADVAERVRAAIAGAPFDVGGATEPLAATASLGVVTLSGGGDPAVALAAADAALYRSKEGGRNRVTTGSV